MFDAWQRFLENQHPIVRSHLGMGIGAVVLMLALHVALRLLGGIVAPQLLFQLQFGLQLLQTLLLLMLALMGFNLLKVTVATLRRRDVFMPRSVILVLLGMFLFAGGVWIMPNVFERAVAARLNMSYDAAYTDFRAACDDLHNQTAAAGEIVYDEAELDLGVLRDTVDTFRVRSTIIFNVGDDDLDFGWACALQGDSPSSAARARHYEYERIEGRYYRFVERAPDVP
ncbi:MAG: hypothetical protein ACLFTK_09035 [Anaerolineales bacterium]